MNIDILKQYQLKKKIFNFSELGPNYSGIHAGFKKQITTSK